MSADIEFAHLVDHAANLLVIAARGERFRAALENIRMLAEQSCHGEEAAAVQLILEQAADVLAGEVDE